MSRFFLKFYQIINTKKGFLIILFISILPSFFVFSLFFFKIKHFNQNEASLNVIYKQAKKIKNLRILKSSFIENYKNTTPYFINKALESLSFKNKEKKELKKILKQPSFDSLKKLKNRLTFLETENKLFFKRQEIYSNAFIKETEEKQSYEVELDKEDIEKILSIIENVQISNNSETRMPQLIIKDFLLEKTNRGSFLLKMNLIQREFK